MTDRWTNYTLAGFNPDDGLTGGRWMRDTWGVVRWVQVEQATIKRDIPRGRNCHECGVETGVRRYFCKACSGARGRKSKREHMARKRRTASS